MTGGRAAAGAGREAGLRGVARVRVTLGPEPPAPEADVVAVEEPLLIRIEHGGASHDVSVTMRTPGDDEALAAGFLLTEDVVERPDDLIEVRRCRPDPGSPRPDDMVVQALLDPRVGFDPARFTRHVYTTSSCGVCGKASLDAVEVSCAPLARGTPRVRASVLAGLARAARDAQPLFAETGGLHATALFDAAGTLVDVAEDVGRHNAMDKVVGRALLRRALPLADGVLVVSGRASFELVQKAARAGCPFLAAVGAPTSLAVALAERLGMTLVGFLGPRGFNIYAGRERVIA